MRPIYFNLIFATALGVSGIGAALAQFSGTVGSTGTSLGGSVGTSAGVGAGTGSVAPADAGSTGVNLLNSLRGQNSQPAAQQAGTAQDAAKSSSESPSDAAKNLPPARTYGPSQFQRYVQETTGRFLPMYGRDLFDSPQAYAADTTLPVPSDYLLGPGDEVQLQV